MNSGRRAAFTLDDVALAYRKAKVDLHYSNDPRPFDLLAYEEGLAVNLDSLLTRLNGRDETWVTTQDFLGEYTVIPKGLNPPGGAPSTTVYVSREDEWRLGPTDGREATFRLLSRCSIDMHVMGALWVGRVGAALDGALGESARGYRLRRTSTGEYNWFSSGSFEPYLNPYRRWQDDGFRAMEQALEAGKRITTVIADASSFFHSIDPSFLDNPDFLERVGAELSRADLRLHRMLVRALKSWQGRMSELLGVPVTGLPLAYPASAVIANLAMLDFDAAIISRARPRYYGRYVDDIILVLENGDALRDSESTWQWLSAQFEPVPGVSLSASEGSHVFSTDYLVGSKIAFDNAKNRVLLMEGESGLSLIKSIRATIAERSSEWRAMAQLPDQPEDVGPRVVRALRPDGSGADSLRTAERMTTSRALFALTVRDFEAFARDLDPITWQVERKAFYTAVRHHILVPQVALEMDPYIARILRIAIHCGDWDEFVMLLEGISRIFSAISEVPVVKLKSTDDNAAIHTTVIHAWGARLRRSIEEAIATTAVEGVRSKALEEALAAMMSLPAVDAGIVLRPKAILQAYHRLFVHDLAYEPFRVQLLPEEIRPASLRGLGAARAEFTAVPTPRQLVRPLEELESALGRSLHMSMDLTGHPAMVYPTRPLAALEVFAITRILSPLADPAPAGFGHWMFATRGFEVDDEIVAGTVTPEEGRWAVHLPLETKRTRSDGKTRVAVTMLEISEQTLMNAMHQRPDHSGTRYRHLARLVDAILRSSTKPDYVLLPELSIPAAWFIGIARKLAGRGISVIAGVEYLHDIGGLVRNQVWASFMTTVLGFPAPVLYRQDKQNPSPHERVALATMPASPLALSPAIPWQAPPLIEHGENWIAILVCSELTNIDYRASLRGKIDALFVPEWNQDLHTFESLVESGALDMHAYIAQANNRAYGDSRVRAPRSAPHERDVVRVKGGVNNYFVVTEVDVTGLRSFQSQASALNGPFKPLPDGFEMGNHRRIVPRVREGNR